MRHSFQQKYAPAARYARDLVARTRARGLADSLADWRTAARCEAGMARDIAGWAARSGPLHLVSRARQYPWFGDFLRHGWKLFDRQVLSRSGHYREANALVVRHLFQVVFIDLLGEVFDHPERVVVHEDMVPPEILHAMGLVPWMAETVGLLMPLVHGPRAEHYIDVAEHYGIIPDTCGLPKITMGVALDGAMPPPIAIVASNMPCDGGMTSYTVIEQALQVPTFRLDIPHDFKSERAEQYFAGELKRLIAWLEVHTPGRMDWNRLREICEVRNRTLALELDLWELLRNRPSPLAGEAVAFNHFMFMQFYPGHPAGIPYFERMLQLCDDAVRNGRGAVAEERFRALLWNPMTQTYPNIFGMAEKRWGTSILMDMLSFRRHPFIDTSTPDTMLRDLATVIMNGPMARHTRGPVDNFFTDIFYLVDRFELDMIWMAEHVGCKNTKALNGMFRELCRDRGIPVLFINDDMSDSRVVSGMDIQRQIDNFMESIMGASPSG